MDQNENPNNFVEVPETNLCRGCYFKTQGRCPQFNIEAQKTELEFTCCKENIIYKEK
jgi:hypothetical protein